MERRFTEYAANMIAYLDTTVPVTFEMQITSNQTQNIVNNRSISDQSKNSVNTPIAIKPLEEKIINVMLETVRINTNNKTDDNLNSTISFPSLLRPLSLSLDEVELSVTGMTDSGLVPGFTYSANPQRINMSNDDSSKIAQMQTNNTYNSKINLVFEKDNIEKIRQNEYTVMIKSSAPERIEHQKQPVENHPLKAFLV